MSGKQRIGILGGAFDPVHLGHIGLALDVLNAGYLDQILVLPDAFPPHKTCAAGAEDRWKMVVSACSCDKRLVPSRLMLDRADSVYTAEFVASLKETYSSSELVCLIGADALMNLRHWRHIDKILTMLSFLVIPRPGTADPSAVQEETHRLTAAGGRFVTAAVSPCTVSSTEIRSSFASGRFPSGLNVSVLEYCSCKGLYGLPGRLEHIDFWIDRLFSSLKPSRFAHSLSVAYTAKRLALLHGIDPLKAEQAGLLHDCAKSVPLEEMQCIAAARSLDADREILSSSALLHSLIGAELAETVYGMSDPEVLDAIRYHNTGFPGMSRLAVCVCLADSIEPLRRDYPHLKEIRTLAESSLEGALLCSLERTAEYVSSCRKRLHPRTLDTIAWLKSLSGNNTHN